jgi:hypothetical protein
MSNLIQMEKDALVDYYDYVAGNSSGMPLTG